MHAVIVFMRARSAMLLAGLLLLMFVAPAALAQDASKATVGLLRFGFYPSTHWMEGAILDLLELYGWINAAEKAQLRERQDLENERLLIFWGDAGFDFNDAALLIDEALDRQPDALITFSTPLTQIALNQTRHMEAPPAIIFADVHNPAEAGIIQASCLKPAHISGVEAKINYEDILPLLLLQHPRLESIGILHHPSQATGSQGAQQIQAIAERQGISVKSAPILSLADVKIAVDSLLSKGVEAILIPYDLSVGQIVGFIAETAMEQGVPVYHASLMSVYLGAAMSAGPYLYVEQGRQAGSMLIAHLNGELDMARAAVKTHDHLAVALNFDVADALGMQFTPALLEMADVIIENGETEMEPAWGLLTQQRAMLPTLAEQQAIDAAFLASLQCADEKIAQQRASLAQD